MTAPALLSGSNLPIVAIGYKRVALVCDNCKRTITLPRHVRGAAIDTIYNWARSAGWKVEPNADFCPSCSS